MIYEIVISKIDCVKHNYSTIKSWYIQTKNALSKEALLSAVKRKYIKENGQVITIFTRNIYEVR